MADVFPRRNLPDLAEQWGRDVEGRVLNLDTSIQIVGQEVQSLNRNTASSLSVIANQITQLEQTQAAIEATQAQIIAAQADITATTNFLSTQTVSNSKNTITIFDGASSGTVWESFNSTYDCSLSVTTGPAGRLLIQASALLGGGGLSGVMAIEIVGETSLSPTGPYTTSSSDATVGASRSVVASLSANTTYTVRLRRGRDGIATGFALWGYQTLVVTRS